VKSYPHSAKTLNRTLSSLGPVSSSFNVTVPSDGVYSFGRTATTDSGTVDVLAVLNWLRTNSWWGDVTVGDIQFGFELAGTAGQSSFVCTTCTITYS
jgi:hypothetical protein